MSLIFSYFDSIMILDEMVVISHVGDELAIMLESGNNFVINVEMGNVEGAYFLCDFMHWTITQGKKTFYRQLGGIYFRKVMML